MDFGQDRLNRPDGAQALVEIMRSTVRESKDDEISQLYQMGALTTGPLCRQRGEPMVSYISSRTRRWVRIKQLDTNVSVTETLLADCLLDCAGLTPDQKRMILTSTSNVKTRHVISIALCKQHSHLHDN